MKDSQLQIYKNEHIGEIKGFIKDGEPWFLAGNVCRCLGIKNTTQKIQEIDAKYKSVEIKGICSTYTLIETKGGKQKSIIIPEPYLYELIFNSRKKKAILFRTWVTTEVLPTLRKYGEYRNKGKMFHKTYTDSIKNEIVPTLSNNGKKFIYSNFQKLINKSLGLPCKNNKDEMSSEMLEKIACRENLVNALINENKTYLEIKETLLNIR